MNDIRFLLLIVAVIGLPNATRAATLESVLSIPGESTDFSTEGVGANANRLGGFGSDLYYDRAHNQYYGTTDRGPGGGLLPFAPRIEEFKLTVDPATGALSNFQLQRTIPYKTADGSESFSGLKPNLLNGDSSVLGHSFDPEGLVVAPGGNFYVSDEYGPSIYEFKPVSVAGGIEARFVRAFSIPDHLVPINNLGQVDYVAERRTGPALVSGRQDNRGFEGLAITPDGQTLYAALEDPLAQEGSSSQGRNSRNVRIAQFDVATGQSTGEFIYQLEDRSDINLRVPAGAGFDQNDQGRAIGVSGMTALNDHQLLVIERDDRGVSPDNLTSGNATDLDVGAKRVYQIDLAGATDASGVSLAGTNSLPADLLPVDKSLLIDIHQALFEAGHGTEEHVEGITVGPLLTSGEYALMLSTDNNSSITQTATGEQFDVYADGTLGPLDGNAQGRSLLPSYLYSFRSDLPNYAAPVPEPGSAVLLASAALAMVIVHLRARARHNLRSI